MIYMYLCDDGERRPSPPLAAVTGVTETASAGAAAAALPLLRAAGLMLGADL